MWRRDDPVEETVGVDTTNPYDTYVDAADGNYPGDESGVATLTLEDRGGTDQIDGSNQTPAVVDADIRDAARAIEEARLVLDRELTANGPGGYDEAMDDAIDAAFARAEETLARTEETAAALSPGSQPPPPGKDKEREGDARAGVDVSSDSAFDGGAGGAGSAAVFRSRSLESSLPPAPASDLSSAAASGWGRVRRYPFVGAAIVQEADRDSTRIFRGDGGALAFEASFPRDEEQADVEGGGDPVRVPCKGSGMERGCRREGWCADVGCFFGRGFRVRVGVWGGL
jgi:hypothetical protein